MMPIKDPEKRRENHKRYMKEWLSRPGKKKQHAARVKINSERYRTNLAEIISNLKDAGCAHCPETAKCCLDFHHLDPSLKEFELSTAPRRGCSVARLMREVAKCELVCRNCHAKIHAGVLVAGQGLEPCSTPGL